MSSGILVFASKQVGLETTRFLFELNDAIQLVVAAKPCDLALSDLAASRGTEVWMYDASTQDRLVERGHRFRWLLNLWMTVIKTVSSITASGEIG